MCVLCPWCDELHQHGFNAEYTQHLRVAHCDPTRNGEVRTLTYRIQFPIHPPHVGYEIDKQNFRFVAGEALASDDSILPDDQAERLRHYFKDQVERKPKWTCATETKKVFQDFSLRTIDTVVAEMVHGNVSYVRKYLETSTEARTFLHGVESWTRLLSEMSDDEAGEADPTKTAVETSGTTALHMAACEQYPEMVDLIISEGADVNAADINGRTPLMEAALWGRLQNVQMLLRAGADKSLACIERNCLQLAADFARPHRKNARSRRSRAGGSLNAEPIYKEDTYARDRDREDIVRLLDGREADLGTPQLEWFAFQRAHENGTLLSLTTLYGLPSEWKAIGRLHRGHGLPEVSAMSGWSHTQNELIQVAGRDWTPEVFQLCEFMGFTLESHRHDQGLAGQFNACHAEKQLVAYAVHKHCFLQHRLDIPGEPDDDIRERLELLAMGGPADEAIQQLQRKQDRREQERAFKTELRRLWRNCPEHSLRQAVIMVSRPVCDDCRRFVAEVNDRFELALLVRHHCLDRSCRECSR